MNSIRYTPERINFETLKEKAACIYILEETVAKQHKTALKGAIKTMKRKMLNLTGEVCYADECHY